MKRTIRANGRTGQKSPIQGNWKWFTNVDWVQEVVIGIELLLNCRPFIYVEGDIQMPLLTSNSFLLSNPTSYQWRKLIKLRLETWRRELHISNGEIMSYRLAAPMSTSVVWEKETVSSTVIKRNQLDKGAGVFRREDERNRNKWELGIVEHLI